MAWQHCRRFPVPPAGRFRNVDVHCCAPELACGQGSRLSEVKQNARHACASHTKEMGVQGTATRGMSDRTYESRLYTRPQAAIHVPPVSAGTCTFQKGLVGSEWRAGHEEATVPHARPWASAFSQATHGTSEMPGARVCRTAEPAVFDVAWGTR